MKTDKQKLIPKRPPFTQENFYKIFNELYKINDFLIKFIALPTWKRMLFGKFIIKKYLNQDK